MRSQTDFPGRMSGRSKPTPSKRKAPAKRTGREDLTRSGFLPHARECREDHFQKKKGELGPPASSPVSSCSFSLWSARDSLVSRFSERGECRAIANHPLINFAALRKRLAGEVRCLRSALRAYAGRESRRKTGNTARRGTDRRYPNPLTNQSACGVQGASSI